MTAFDFALAYVFENEGIDSNHPLDRGGKTRYGITSAVAAEHGYDVSQITPHVAAKIYRADYWRFDSVNDRRVAAKIMDVCVNVGLRSGVRLVQKALGVQVDGIFGPDTATAINTRNSEDVIERISKAVADYYLDIVENRPEQRTFLRGWIRRAIRRPHLEVKGA